MTGLGIPPVLAVRPGDRPTIACPAWCSLTYEHHLADLGELDGFVHHFSAPVRGVTHSLETYPDGTDSGQGARVYLEAPSELNLVQAEALAKRLLAVIEEARS
ncbi:hypothetical protein ACIRN4_16245 [Pimelobacter simplex]|uniref:hypothetical protein n=1 Tax=Nocardioides simplex TaxID=2045 RepID=UPI003807896E